MRTTPVAGPPEPRTRPAPPAASGLPAPRPGTGAGECPDCGDSPDRCAHRHAGRGGPAVGAAPAGWVLGLARLRRRLARRRRAVAGWLAVRFRLPAPGDPAPHPARLAGVCAWAAALGLAGLLVAARVAVAILVGEPAGWFLPVMVTVGLVGMVLTAGSFAAIHRRWLPWMLLAAATGPLQLNLVLALAL